MADYGMESLVRELNRAAARAGARGGRRVRGGPSPTGRASWPACSARPTATASISPDVNDPGFRNVTFDELVGAYAEAARGLLEGGADLLLIETIFDTLNAKAAIFAIEGVFERAGRAAAGDDLRHHHRPERPHPVGPDRRGVLELGGARPAAVHRPQLRAGRQGSCGQYVQELSRIAPVFVSTHPNAGLPERVRRLRRERRSTWRGCSASSPARAGEHRRRLLRHHAGAHPRHRGGGAGRPAAGAAHGARPACRLSGLEPLTIGAETNFVNVGERHQRHRLAPVREADPRRQVRGGARGGAAAGGERRADHRRQHGRGDARLRAGDDARSSTSCASEPDISRVPVMIDSLQVVGHRGGAQVPPGQGRRQLDQPQGGRGGVPAAGDAGAALRRGGGRDGLRRAGPGRHRRAQGGDRERAYRLLTERVGFAPEDIIFDPNIFAIATGIEEHDGYAVAYIEATRRIKATLPHALSISGGVSNVSFSFRGNDPVREAIHTVFLYHAIQAGMDMGIVNAGAAADLRRHPDGRCCERVEDVVLNRRPDAHRAPAGDRRLGEGPGGGEAGRPGVAQPAGGGAAGARAGGGHRRLHRGGHRGGAAARRPGRSR